VRGRRSSVGEVHDDRVLVEKRIERELMQRVVPAMYRNAAPLSVEAWDVPGEPATYAEAANQTYRPFSVGSTWSRPWGTTWFRLTGEVPAEWAGGPVEAVVDLGFAVIGAGFQAEGLVWRDGRPLQGVHPRRTGVPLHDLSAGPFTLMVEAASNPTVWTRYRPTPLGSLRTAGDAPLYTFRRADLALRDDDVYHLLLDVETLQGTMLALHLDDPRRQRILRRLEAAFDALDLDNVGATAAAARAELADALAVPARASSMRVVGVGHAHIDSAWLWPVRETVRKCARTFASAVRLMDDLPEYRFVCSQAVQYHWMETRYPALFEAMRTKVAEGRFVPVGGMWVEPDMNLPSGESIVRQLIHGQRYFESRFGRRCQEVWIPDVFGYPATLPQIFAQAGCHRFVTQKLSWNKQNRFPHHTFHWEGLDGTRVLAHFPPVDTYNAEVIGAEMVASERNFREHGWSDWALMPYGHGNGGGGPTREMVERGLRMRDLDGVPRVQFGTVDDFFEQVEREELLGAKVPVWRGELYFEMHRGTLTSQIETKVGNRRCERLLREAELWWATGGLVPVEVQAELDELWRDVLLQQFHDILPGSSIAWVHEDAEAEHRRIAARLDGLIGDALERLAPPNDVVANATMFARREVMEFDDDREPIVVEVPGSGLAALVDVGGFEPVVTTEHSMSNGLVAVQWDTEGTVISIIDLVRGRELLPVAERVELTIAPDHPVEYDAWDLEHWTRPKAVPVGGVGPIEFVERGPLVARLALERRFGDSSSRETITVRAGSARVEFGFDIDWHEHERLLSLRVPLDVRADLAACDVQFGHVMRPTHASSPWDAAKFEVCAHRYVDLAEPTFGVAVLNDGRFGHGLFDGGITVSLLRGARYPDPEADQGRHRCTIAVFPHGAGLDDVRREAEALNAPLRIVHGSSPEPGTLPRPVVTIDQPGVELAAVKRADDGSGDLIVRISEARGDRTTASVRAAVPVRGAARCDLLETPITALDVADGFVALVLRPFELVTLRLAT
jgi:alpha-mannosidase